MLRTPRFHLGRAGFYSFRERLIGASLVSEFTTPCAAVSETSLGAAEIVTGRGDVARAVQVPSGASAPARVRMASLGIDAPVSAVGIDIARGVLGVPPPIHRTAWWKDGAAPGAKTGSILIAGHVDNAAGGVGAFFRLHEASRGALVTVTTRAGRIFTYRVVSVRNYPKNRLPTSVWSLRGRPRLVLVTCGGPFLAALGPLQGQRRPDRGPGLARDLAVPEAADDVVVDEAARLHQRVADRRPDEPEAATLQLLRQRP